MKPLIQLMMLTHLLYSTIILTLLSALHSFFTHTSTLKILCIHLAVCAENTGLKHLQEYQSLSVIEYLRCELSTCVCVCVCVQTAVSGGRGCWHSWARSQQSGRCEQEVPPNLLSAQQSHPLTSQTGYHGGDSFIGKVPVLFKLQVQVRTAYRRSFKDNIIYCRYLKNAGETSLSDIFIIIGRDGVC